MNVKINVALIFLNFIPATKGLIFHQIEIK